MSKVSLTDLFSVSHTYLLNTELVLLGVEMVLVVTVVTEVMDVVLTVVVETGAVAVVTVDGVLEMNLS